MSSYVPRKRYGTEPETGLKLEDTDVRYVNERGDKMKGPLDMNGNKITNVSSPVEDNEVINKAYFKQKLDKKVEKTKLDIKTELKTDLKLDINKDFKKTKEDLDKDLLAKFTYISMIFNDKVAKKDDIMNLKDEIKDIIQSTIKESLDNPEQSKIDKVQKINEKKLHAKLRKASYLSFIPTNYLSIVRCLYPIWREPPFASEEKKFIYFPGKRDNEKPLNLAFNLPKNCTIFMVVKFLDKVGLIYIKKDDQYIFSLSQLFVVHLFEEKVVKTLEIGKQYSIE